VLFCLLSSAVYLFNDLLDYEQDRVHPEKRHRPLAISFAVFA
jgi:4-hydroxybenzoate polyprenyltransferase